MSREAWVFDFTEEGRIVGAVERPAVEKRREEQPPPARVPLAIEELALLLERLEREQPLDLATAVNEQLHDFHDHRDELLAHAARERPASQHRLVCVPETRCSLRQQRPDRLVGSEASFWRTAGDTEEAHYLRHCQAAKRSAFQLHQVILGGVEIHGGNPSRTRCEQRQRGAAARANDDDLRIMQRSEGFDLQARILSDLREEEPVFAGARKLAAGNPLSSGLAPSLLNGGRGHAAN